MIDFMKSIRSNKKKYTGKKYLKTINNNSDVKYDHLYI